MNEGLAAAHEQTRVLSCNRRRCAWWDASLPEGDEEVSVYTLDRSGEFQAVVDEALKGQRCEKIMGEGLAPGPGQPVPNRGACRRGPDLLGCH